MGLEARDLVENSNILKADSHPLLLNSTRSASASASASAS